MKNWEDLKEFKPLKRNTIRSIFRDFFLLVGKKLQSDGFRILQTSYTNKLFRISHDIIEIIEFNNHDSFRQENERFTIKIGLVPLCSEYSDHKIFAAKSINEIDTTIGNYDILTQEYHLLADFLYKRIVLHILPYFSRYNTTQKILDCWQDFEYKTKLGGEEIKNSHYLILFSELKQNKIRFTNEILEKEIIYFKDWYKQEVDFNGRSVLKQNIKKWKELKKYVQKADWEKINYLLSINEKKTLEKLQKYN